MDPLVLLDLSVRVLLAIVVGGTIGLERQWRLQTAGTITDALVSVGASLFVILGAGGLGEGETADPTRVAAQRVSGIGFLSAGIILRDGFNIRGLTTAATLWCAAAIGSLAGARMKEMAVIGCAAIISTNTLLRPFSQMINRRTRRPEEAPSIEEDADIGQDYLFDVVTTEKSEQRVRALVVQAATRPEHTRRSIDVKRGKNSTGAVLAGVFALSFEDAGVLERALQRISLDHKVTASRWWQAEIDD